MIPPQVKIFDDLERLAEAASEHFVKAVKSAVEAGRPAMTVISGGGTPKAMFQCLAQKKWAEQVPWDKVHVFWADERLVPADDQESNYGSACKALFDHLPGPKPHLHRVLGEAGPEAALAQCLTDLKQATQLQSPGDVDRRWPLFDVVFLGMGADGHTASLFPGPIPAEDADIPARCVTAQYENRPALRITLTPAALNDAREIVFLATDSNKAAVLAAALQGPPQPDLIPVQRIRPESGRMTWLVDAGAAAQLGNR